MASLKMLIYIVFFALLAIFLYKSTRKPEKFPPGPPKLPMVGSLPYLNKSGSFAQISIDLAKKYGPVCGLYLGRKPMVIVTDYNILKGTFVTLVLLKNTFFVVNLHFLCH